MSGMADSRRAPFCYQTVSVMATIRERFEGEERRTAVALYQAMTEVANECRRSGGRDGFEAPRKRMADYAGCTVRTLDKYAELFVEMGILAVKRRKKGNLNLPNVWRLVDPEGGATNSTTPTESHHPGAAKDTRGSAANSTPVQEEGQEEQQYPPYPPQAGGLPALAPPTGKRKRDLEKYADELGVWCTAVLDLGALPEDQHPEAHQAAKQFARVPHADDIEDARYFIAEWFPNLTPYLRPPLLEAVAA